MKKSIVCLFLGILMLLPFSLTGCGNSGAADTSQDKAARAYTTLSFWIVTEDETTKEAIDAMQEVFNEACKQKYSTQVIFTFCTADEYRAKLDEKLASVDAEAERLKAEKESLKSDKNSTGSAETIVDDDGMTVVQYPELSSAQLDIVLITGKEMYTDLASRGVLLSLNAQLAGSYKDIAKTVYPELLTYSAVNGNYYAIPNKRVIGEYTYLLVDKAMAAKYYKKASDITTVASVYDLVQMVAENEDRSEIAPLLAPFEYPTLRYWSKDYERASLIGSLYAGDMERGHGPVYVRNLLAQEDYRKYATMMFDAELNDYYVKGNEDFAVGVVTGDYGDRFAYAEKYHCVPVNNPRISEDDVFGAMFGVTKYTVNLARSLEIVQDLLINSGLRNILQYGVENEDFMKNADGTVTLRSTTNYFMKQEYTGSMFTVYPCTNLGQTAEFTQYAAQQNRDHCSDVFYECESFFEGVDTGKWSMVDEFSSKLFARLSMCVSVDEYRQTLKDIVTELDGDSSEAVLVRAMLRESYLDQPDRASIAGSILAYRYYLNENL